MINSKEVKVGMKIFCGFLKYFILAILIILIALSILQAQDVTAINGMVASAHPIASEAGLEILKKGGNAVDAVVATAFALSVVEPNASGIGGGGFLVIKMADSTEAVSIDYREMAPGSAKANLYYQSKDSFRNLTSSGPHSVGVPGVIAGLCLALEKYGTMKLAEVLEPAIRFANEGFTVSEKFAVMIIQNYELIQNHPATAQIYLQDGLPYEAGALIKNKDLANTFEKLAKKGPRVFYRGEIGKAIVHQITSEGGRIAIDDLQKYQAIIRQPICGTYREYKVISSAPPSGGGTHLIEFLNILEGYDLKEMKHNSTDYIHLLAETMKIVLVDKAENMADPSFYKIPIDKLTNKNYALTLRKFIDMKKASFKYQPPHLLMRESGSTTHMSVVDHNHNLVALTQSINLWFGSGITIENTGILLNNHLADFSPVPGKPNSIEPYKRPVSSIAPTIVLKDSKPFLTIGTPGGSRIIGALGQIIINVIDFGMSIDQAIEAPRIHAFRKTLYLEGRISQSVVNELKQRGHNIKIRKDFDNYFGGAQGILINPENNHLYGGADSRRDGVVIGF